MADHTVTEPPILARGDQSSGPAAPDGLHAAVCVDVINLGDVATNWGTKPKVRIVWQLADEDPTTRRRYVVSRMYTLSLGPKASLRRDLESWRGKAFSPEELLGGFDLLRLIGANAHNHHTANGGQM